MLRRKDPLRGQKIIASAILTGLSMIAFSIARDGKALYCFILTVFAIVALIQAWTGKSFTKALSKALEHPDTKTGKHN
jgi:hypothetical protein